MLNMNYTTEILNLEDVIVTDVKILSEELHIHLHLPQSEQVCPRCGAVTKRIHDYRLQTIKDVPFGRTTYLHLRKRRYACPCGKRFAEQNRFLAKYRRTTTRLVATVIDAFRKLVPATEIAARFNLSTATAVRYFSMVNYQCTELPEVLAIDEFAGNADRERYQTITVDLKNRKIIDILPNRRELDLIRYFRQFPSRYNVKYFVSDMSNHFRAVAKACFPNAKRIADKFHVVRQAVWAMDRVRKAEQKKLAKKLRVRFKHSKYLLNKKWEKLTEDDMNRLATMFEISPRLADAYRLKNELIALMQSKSSKEGMPKLKDWLHSVELLDMEEFRACAAAYRNWYQEILNAMDYPWTNGFTEGCNNKIKVLKRVCYGIQNFKRFRSRILHCAR